MRNLTQLMKRTANQERGKRLLLLEEIRTLHIHILYLSQRNNQIVPQEIYMFPLHQNVHKILFYNFLNCFSKFFIFILVIIFCNDSCTQYLELYLISYIFIIADNRVRPSQQLDSLREHFLTISQKQVDAEMVRQNLKLISLIKIMSNNAKLLFAQRNFKTVRSKRKKCY